MNTPNSITNRRVDLTESRSDRLARDFREMLKLRDRPYCTWIVTKGEPPCAEEYLLSVRLRTYALSVKDGRYTVGVIRRCTVRVTLWDSYPAVAPDIRMLSIPPVFHPSWYSKGTYCPREPWRPDSSLKDYVMQMLAALRYEPPLTETDLPANYKALDWYRKNRHRDALFPSDKTALTENGPDEIAAMEKNAPVFDEVVDSWPV